MSPTDREQDSSPGADRSQESPATRRLWRAHRDKVLYLVVGGWNVAFQYAVFSLCWYLLGDKLHPDVVLLLATVIGMVNGYLGFRYIVFGPSGHPLFEFLRFQVVYLPILLVNMVLLPLLLRHTSLNAYVIQAVWSVAAVVIAYLGNKYYTFRKKPTEQ
jgi:putative flippase GtrA